MRTRELWLQAFRQVGIKAISTDTAARIMAIIYVHGGAREDFTFNANFLEDMRYIQDEYGIDGACTPDTRFTVLCQKYVQELEDYEREHPRDYLGREIEKPIPEWAVKLINERYNIQL